MTPVDQTITDKNRGDCQRAAVASLLDLEIEQVPHFRLFHERDRHRIFCNFLYACGYEWEGSGYPHTHRTPRNYPTIKGYVIATVPSKHYFGEKSDEGRPITHAVIIDSDGVVVHDPHPDKDWQDINIIESGDIIYWTLIGISK